MEKSNFNKFLFLWGGQLISAIGSGLTAFGLGVYVYAKTGSATAMAIVTLMAFLPSLLLAPFAGVLADRYDRRLLMLLGDGLSALGLIYVLICIWDGNATLEQICVGTCCSSIFAALTEPAYKATVTDLLSKEQYSKASGLVQSAGSTKYLISPILAGLLLTVSDIRLLLILDISTFFVTAGVTLIVKRSIIPGERAPKRTFWAEFTEGFGEILHTKGLMRLIILASVLTCFIGVIQTLSTPLVLSFTNCAALGILETVVAMGMLVSSVILGVVAIKDKYVPILATSLLAAGLAMIAFGFKENMVLLGVSGFVFFAALPPANTCLECLLRVHVPNKAQGRVWGICGIISQFGYVVAYSLSGFLADHVFTPLLVSGGALENSLGQIFGVGAGRGIGLMISIAGVCTCVIAILINKDKTIKKLEVIK